MAGTWSNDARRGSHAIIRLDEKLRLHQNSSMDLQVFASPELTGEARRFLAPFEVNSIVSSIRDFRGERVRSVRCLLYLSGHENSKQVSNSLRALARWKVHTIVLFARKADHRTVVDWARVAERVLPRKTEFCFSAPDVARVLKLRPRSGSATPSRSSTGRVDIEELRTTLGLTQTQLASAAGVSERTVQNWEAGRLSPQAERRVRDVVELKETLTRYIAPDSLQQWLISPNETFAGDAPRDWIIDGRARDVLWEFRRMQVGEPA
jgi:transcriptional regulator with XRE-family HTH domain